MFKYINLDPSFQGVNRLFVMAYSRANNQPTKNGQQKYYLPRIDLEKYNVIIDGRNFYDNPIESDIEKYTELKKIMIGKGEDYTTGSLLDFNYFDKHYKLVAVDLSKQKELDADPRAMPLVKNVLAPLELTAAMSAIDGSIQKKIHSSGIKLIIEEEDMQDIIKIIKELENSDILLKGVSKTIENEIKEQRGGFLSMLLGTLGASLLGNLLTGKGIMRAGDGIVRAGEGSKKNPKFAITFSSINKYKNK